jgi:hypothetical protein
MRRPTAALTVAALGALPVAGVALAATSPKPVTATDAPRDVASTLDLTRVSVARGSDGRLRATITLAQAFEPADLRASSGPPGSVCLKVWAATVPPDQAPDHLVCATVDAKGRLRGSVLRERANRLPERVAPADVSRPSSRSLRLRFAQSAVGRPAKPRVAAETTKPGCAAVTCVDTAPDAPKTLTLRLRAS